MRPFRYTLVAEGTSDRCLTRIIEFVLTKSLQQDRIIGSFADPTYLQPARNTLAEKVASAIRMFPCDALFVHRDADRTSVDDRTSEIEEASSASFSGPTIPVIPLRMTEAWLLIDESAIRRAADNPGGQEDLDLPRLNRIEQVPDPKRVLFDALILACEKRGRRLEQFKRVESLAARRVRVAELIANFDPLRQLSAFQLFASRTSAAMRIWREGISRS